MVQRPPISSFLSTVPSSWLEAVEVGMSLRGWIFRGQGNATWLLETSLERAQHVAGEDLSLLSGREFQMIRKFQKYAAHKRKGLSLQEDYPEWLALMQHHGCPTRLLDFTRSFYVAAFFALELTGVNAVVWAVNHDAILRNHPLPAHFPQSGLPMTDIQFMMNRHANQCIFSDDCVFRGGQRQTIDDVRVTSILGRPNIIIVTPRRPSRRLDIQQGLFVMPTIISKPFEENLASVFSNTARASFPTPVVVDWAEAKRQINDPGVGHVLIRIELPTAIAKVALTELARMNITRETLFPGFDGFTGGLRSLFYTPLGY